MATAQVMANSQRVSINCHPQVQDIYSRRRESREGCLEKRANQFGQREETVLCPRFVSTDLDVGDRQWKQQSKTPTEKIESIKVTYRRKKRTHLLQFLTLLLFTRSFPSAPWIGLSCFGSRLVQPPEATSSSGVGKGSREWGSIVTPASKRYWMKF